MSNSYKLFEGYGFLRGDIFLVQVKWIVVGVGEFLKFFGWKHRENYARENRLMDKNLVAFVLLIEGFASRFLV
jgi:hypothetical protein